MRHQDADFQHPRIKGLERHFRRDFCDTSWKPCPRSNPKLGGMASRCASLFIGSSSRSPVGVAPRAVRRTKSRVVAKTVWASSEPDGPATDSSLARQLAPCVRYVRVHAAIACSFRACTESHIGSRLGHASGIVHSSSAYPGLSFVG